MVNITLFFFKFKREQGGRKGREGLNDVIYTQKKSKLLKKCNRNPWQQPQEGNLFCMSKLMLI